MPIVRAVGSGASPTRYGRYGKGSKVQQSSQNCKRLPAKAVRYEPWRTELVKEGKVPSINPASFNDHMTGRLPACQLQLAFVSLTCASMNLFSFESLILRSSIIHISQALGHASSSSPLLVALRRWGETCTNRPLGIADSSTADGSQSPGRHVQAGTRTNSNSGVDPLYNRLELRARALTWTSVDHPSWGSGKAGYQVMNDACASKDSTRRYMI